MKTKRKTTYRRAVAAAVLSSLLFVIMGIWIRMMASSFATWQQAYIRILLAGLIAAVLFRKKITPDILKQVKARDWLVYGVRGVLQFTFGVGFFTIAVQHAQLSTVSFVSSLPILGILAWLMFRERVRLSTLPFIALSVVGLILLTGVKLGSLRLGWGEQAAIISMLGFDAGYMMARYHSKKFSNFQNTTLMLLLGWIPLFGVSIALHEPLIPTHVSAAGWIGLMASSIQNVFVLYLINYVFGHLKAYVAGNILLLEGVFAIIIGFVIYSEVPTGVAVVGAMIILASAYAISTIEARSDRVHSAQMEELS